MTDDLRVEREGPIAVLTFNRPDTDIRQFLDFKTAEDALDYEARLTRVPSKLAGMKKPTIAPHADARARREPRRAGAADPRGDERSRPPHAGRGDTARPRRSDPVVLSEP